MCREEPGSVFLVDGTPSAADTEAVSIAPERDARDVRSSQTGKIIT